MILIVNIKFNFCNLFYLYDKEKNSVNTYCQVQLNRQVFKTKVVKDDIFPHWNQVIRIFAVKFLFIVYDI